MTAATRAPRWTADPASDKQTALIRKLLGEKILPADRVAVICYAIDEGELTKGLASAFIDALFAAPRKPADVDLVVVLDAPAADPVSEVGIYERDGQVWKVVRSGAGRLYAKVLVINGKRRITEAGEYVTGDFEYEPGAIHQVRAADRCTLERAQELGRLTSSCIVCGTKLEDRKSVERGIGPSCAKRVGA